MAKMDKNPSSRSRRVSGNVQGSKVVAPVVVQVPPAPRIIKEKNFFNGLLSDNDPRSSKRFVTLIIAALFIITCATVLILFVILFVSVTRLQRINIEALKVTTSLLSDIIKYEMIIVVFGLAFVTVAQREGFAKILLAKGAETVTTTTTTGGDTVVTDPKNDPTQYPTKLKD